MQQCSPNISSNDCPNDLLQCYAISLRIAHDLDEVFTVLGRRQAQQEQCLGRGKMLPTSTRYPLHRPRQRRTVAALLFQEPGVATLFQEQLLIIPF